MEQPTKRYRVRRTGERASLAILSVISVGVLLAVGCGQQSAQPDAESQQDVTTSGTNLLPEHVLVASDVVQNYFPEVDHQTTTGENANAPGAPEATRMVIYEGGEGRKVTISVDQYPSPDAASTAYEIGRAHV